MKYIYVMEMGEHPDHCKVGITSDVNKRIQQLQAGNPYQITLAFCMRLDDGRAFNAEQSFIASFKTCRIRGEWFETDAHRAVKALMDFIYFDWADTKKFEPIDFNPNKKRRERRPIIVQQVSNELVAQNINGAIEEKAALRKEDVVKFYGSAANAATALDISRSAVHQWGEHVPMLSALKIQAQTNGELMADGSHKEQAVA